LGLDAVLAAALPGTGLALAEVLDGVVVGHGRSRPSVMVGTTGEGQKRVTRRSGSVETPIL
jgi:hypothetical protein